MFNYLRDLRGDKGPKFSRVRMREANIVPLVVKVLKSCLHSYHL